MDRVKIGKKTFVSVGLMPCGKHQAVYFEEAEQTSGTSKTIMHKQCIWDEDFMSTFLNRVAPVLHQYMHEPIYEFDSRIFLDGYLFADPAGDEIGIGLAQRDVRLTVQDYWRFWSTVPDIVKAMELSVDSRSMAKAQLGKWIKKLAD